MIPSSGWHAAQFSLALVEHASSSSRFRHTSEHFVLKKHNDLSVFFSPGLLVEPQDSGRKTAGRSPVSVGRPTGQGPRLSAGMLATSAFSPAASICATCLRGRPAPRRSKPLFFQRLQVLSIHPATRHKGAEKWETSLMGLGVC